MKEIKIDLNNEELAKMLKKRVKRKKVISILEIVLAILLTVILRKMGDTFMLGQLSIIVITIIILVTGILEEKVELAEIEQVIDFSNVERDINKAIQDEIDKEMSEEE